MKSKFNVKAIYILLVGLFVLLPTVNGAPGDFDPTFSGDGKIIHRFGGSNYDYSSASVLQPDGKIVVIGKVVYGNQFSCGIVRYNPDGSPDLTFDEDGKTFVSVRRGWSCRSVALQADGKIVAVGATGSDDYEPRNDGDFVVVRLNADGSPDATFDGDGKLITRLSEFQDMANDVVIQPDGKIVVVGIRYTGFAYPGWYVSDFAAVRYNPNGTLDTTFDGDGIVTTAFSGYEDYANGVSLQTDGKIVVVGKSYVNTVEDFALVRYNPDGSLDTTFDGDGKVVSNLFNSNEIASSVVILADGKILTAGSYNSGNFFVLARYNPDGTLDTAFGDNGRTSTPNSSYFDRVGDLAVQPDGKIVASVGYRESFPGNTHFAVYRYNADGTLDGSFDGDGKAVTVISNAGGFSDEILIQPDGKIVATGFGWISHDNELNTDYAVVRYNPDGSLDNGFSGDGKTTTDVSIRTSGATAVVNQPDGKILAVGNFGDGIMVVRYNADGSFDSTFDADGVAFVSGAWAIAMDLQTDGKIVVAGGAYSASTRTDFAIVRLNPDGSPDSTFDNDGIVFTTVSGNEDNLRSVAIQPDGKIVAAGSSNSADSIWNFALVRYNSNGTLDKTFNGSGVVTTAISGNVSFAHKVLIQPDGRIVAAGHTFQPNTGYGFAAARYNANGSLDNTFDNDGKAVIPMDSGGVSGTAALQTDGKIVLAGYETGSYNFAVVRLNPDGSPDTSFDGDGKAITSTSDSPEYAAAVAVQPDGKIIAAGYGGVEFGLNDFTLVRYNSDGSLDKSFAANPTAPNSNGGIIRLDLQGESDDVLSGMALDSSGRIVLVGESNGFFTVARIHGVSATPNALFDFDGDRKTDISIFRAGSGEWWINRSSNGATSAVQFGTATDKIVPADFTGDGKTDVAVWRAATGEWFILRSEDNSFYSVPFGTTGDVPVPADFDGDAKADLAVYRPSTFTWYISKSSGGYQVTTFGAANDVPVTGDYDRDGKSDIAIYRPSDGSWWILKSSTSATTTYQFGNSTDIPVQGDYTGDGRTDSALWRPSTGEWFILRSEDNSYYSVSFGASGDLPTPGDYDGDGRFDAAVFRPTGSTWYVNRSTSGLLITSFGLSSDKPVPSAFVP